MLKYFVLFVMYFIKLFTLFLPSVKGKIITLACLITCIRFLFLFLNYIGAVSTIPGV